jgi:LmbE family N-acetylglucosaminyl deacetylase
MQLHFFLGVRLEEARPAFVVDITDEYRRKMEVLSCYESQFAVDMNNLAASDYWGPMIGRSYGEAFWSRRTIGIANLFDLTLRER